MPTYEYKCDSCGYAFEKIQSIKADPLKECPKCSKAIRRIIGSGAGIIFKGSGFYQTDYKKSSPKKDSCCPKLEDKNAKCGDSPCCHEEKK